MKNRLKKCFITLLLAGHRHLKWAKSLQVCVWRYKRGNKEKSNFFWFKGFHAVNQKWKSRSGSFNFFITAIVLVFQGASESLEGLLKQMTGPSPSVSDSVDLS